MTSIFPSEQPQWGWLVPCLACPDVSATMAFYAKLGFTPNGGVLKEGWAILRNGPTELHLFSTEILPKDLLNFRGGDREGIRAALSQAGIDLVERTPRSFSAIDPEGREVFFDIGEPEVSQLAAGQPLTVPLPEGAELHERTLDLGNFTWCVTCEDLAATTAFYGAMGLGATGGQPEHGYAVLTRADHPRVHGQRMEVMCLALFVGLIPEDTLNFRGGDVSAIAAVLAGEGVDLCEGIQVGEDGGESLLIRDNDRRAVLFDTTPPERLY
jgi:catechol 2,3-dioxygenase-like lactoylglutathione lyase family enzyme